MFSSRHTTVCWWISKRVKRFESYLSPLYILSPRIFVCVCVCVRSALCLGFHFPVSYLSTAQALICDTVFAAALSVCLCMCSQLVKDLLNALPGMFTHTRETQSALGPALQAAYKLMCPTGGRVSVFQTQLPTLGAGLLQSREDPNLRSSTKVTLLNHHSSSTNADPK